MVIQYARGRAKEYRCMELLKREGYVVGRSAGSHSPVDLFAAKDGRVMLIQVKSGTARVKKDELRELVKWAEAFNADAEVWHFMGRGNLQKRRVSMARE
ncbi:MAG: restriction endonuclease [Nitrososphaerales archaeon]